MTNEERDDTRWDSLMALQEGLERDLPPRRGEAADRGGRPRHPSAKAARFAEALSISTTWSGISEARHRRRPAA